MNAIFGERIKFHRERLSMTQEELGKKLGVSGVTIMRYEKGQREPSFHQIEALSEIFDVSPSYLVGWEAGSRLTQAREKAGLSQEELAKQANISVEELLRYETNEVQPDKKILGVLAKLCNTNPNFLYYSPSKFANLGQRLQTIREECGMSQSEAAEKSSITLEELQELENLKDMTDSKYRQKYAPKIHSLVHDVYELDFYDFVSGGYRRQMFDQAIGRGIISYEMVAQHLNLSLQDVMLYAKNYTPNPFSDSLIINTFFLIHDYDQVESTILDYLTTLTPFARKIAADRIVELAMIPEYRRKDCPAGSYFMDYIYEYPSFDSEIVAGLATRKKELSEEALEYEDYFITKLIESGAYDDEEIEEMLKENR